MPYILIGKKSTEQPTCSVFGWGAGQGCVWEWGGCLKELK